MSNKPPTQPTDISAAAAKYYENASGPIVPPDLDNAADLHEFRKSMDEGGLEYLTSIDFEFTQQDDEIAGVPVVRMRGSMVPATDRVLLHIHGGGYIVGSARGNGTIPLQVAEALDLEVISANYRLAPEHPFPAAVDDTLAVFRELLNKFEPDKIGLFGESAGGGLVAALALALRDSGDPLPGALMLIAPFTDLTGSSDSIMTNDGFDPDLNWHSLESGANAYAATEDLKHPQISPVFADFSGLPPILIQVGSRDILLGDALRIARTARDKGVDVELDVWEGMWHCFHFDPALPESKQACQEIAAFFRRHL